MSIDSENPNVFQAKTILINLHASPQASKYSLSCSRRLLRCVPVFTSAPSSDWHPIEVGSLSSAAYAVRTLSTSTASTASRLAG